MHIGTCNISKETFARLRTVTGKQACANKDSNEKFQFSNGQWGIWIEGKVYIIKVLSKFNRKYKHHKKQKFDRNAPCPCGSGKKYKKCCYQLLNKKPAGGANEETTADVSLETESK